MYKQMTGRNYQLDAGRLYLVRYPENVYIVEAENSRSAKVLYKNGEPSDGRGMLFSALLIVELPDRSPSMNASLLRNEDFASFLKEGAE